MNTSFYAIPARQTVERWMESVRQNPEFLFSVKLYKQFTHRENIRQGDPEIAPANIEAFKMPFQLVLTSKRLGALLPQFPTVFITNRKTWITC